MREIILKKRYPHSREEDITDAFMRGYEKGKADRPQGEWIEENGRVICSECRRNALRTMTGCLMDRHLDYNKSKFCPNCGCAMTKE